MGLRADTPSLAGLCAWGVPQSRGASRGAGRTDGGEHAGLQGHVVGLETHGPCRDKGWVRALGMPRAVGTPQQGPRCHPRENHKDTPARTSEPPRQGYGATRASTAARTRITPLRTLGPPQQGSWAHPGKDHKMLLVGFPLPLIEALLGEEKPPVSSCPHPCPRSSAHMPSTSAGGTYTRGLRGSCQCRGRSHGHS